MLDSLRYLAVLCTMSVCVNGSAYVRVRVYGFMCMIACVCSCVCVCVCLFACKCLFLSLVDAVM